MKLKTQNGCTVEPYGSIVVLYVVTLPSGSKREKHVPADWSQEQVKEYFEQYSLWSKSKYPEDFNED